MITKLTVMLKAELLMLTLLELTKLTFMFKALTVTDQLLKLGNVCLILQATMWFIIPMFVHSERFIV